MRNQGNNVRNSSYIVSITPSCPEGIVFQYHNTPGNALTLRTLPSVRAGINQVAASAACLNRRYPHFGVQRVPTVCAP